MSDFPKALEEELAALEADLATNPDPRILKVEHLRSLRALYSGARAPNLMVIGSAENSAVGRSIGDMARMSPRSLFLPTRGVKGVRRRVDPGRIKVMEAARDIVSEFKEPVKTAYVYDLMTPEIQAMIGGSEPKGNLSAMMHHSPLFQSHGRAGWTIAEPDAPDDDGSDPDMEREARLTNF